MWLLVRSIAAALVFVAAFLFSYWMVFAQFLSQNTAYVPTLVTAAVAALATWHVTGPGAHGIAATALRWAAIVGGLGFCAGFFGPIVIDPGANQGPMLGLFITGPLGFVAGGVGGLVYALWRRYEAPKTS